jgi:hypothetical protein
MATTRTVSAVILEASILSGNFTNEDLNGIARAVNAARASLARKNANTLSVGIKVTFPDSRNNRVLSGTVESIKVKNASVRCAGTLYRVPMNMLTAV